MQFAVGFLFCCEEYEGKQMKRVYAIFLILGIGSQLLLAQEFARYFTDATLRIDYFHVGSREAESIVPDQLYRVEGWPGSQHNLVDTLNLGMYLVKVYNAATNRLIFSYGYSTLFNEWQTTQEAIRGGKKVIHETVRIPFPKQKVVVEFYRRDKQNLFTRQIGVLTIDPLSDAISTEDRASDVMVIPIQEKGDATHHLDIAIIADGYTRSQKSDFEVDAQRLVGRLLQVEPFRAYAEKINVYALFRPSADSGTDDPRKGVFKNTAINTSFNTFGSQRYLMSFDNRSIQDIASAVPFDALFLVVNTTQYGGGGIYNLYACTASDNRWSEYIFVHEFGHSFGGLGDEYYTSDVAYSDFYPKGVEPWEPNVTALLNPPKVKWQKFVTPGIPIPTPWDKQKFDEREKKYRQKLRELREKNAPEEEIDRLRNEQSRWVEEFFSHHKYRDVVGAFEGAGYASQGLYRPALNCIMFSRGNIPFDPVCRNAIETRIRFIIE